MVTRRKVLGGIGMAAAMPYLVSTGVMAADPVIRIGQIGVMSGEAASWGLVNRYAAEAQAKMINDAGGWDIDGQRYRIEIVSVDDRNDPRTAIAGAERLIYQEGIKYIIGTNVDDTTQAIIPALKAGNAFAISYGQAKELFSQPNENVALGMVAGYQVSPIIFKYLVEERGAKTVAFLARNDFNGLDKRGAGIEAAKAIGLDVVSADATYEPGTGDYFPVLSPIIQASPDVLVLSGVAPSDAGQIIRAARDLGFAGIVSTETGQDAATLRETAGAAADGFISLGGASTPEIRTEYAEEFMRAYESVAGEWNDEAGTKIYALEMILQTLRAAGAAALDDIEPFKAAIGQVDVENPFIKEGTPRLSWIGDQWFGQKRQLNVPVVVNEFRDGEFVTLVVDSVV